MTLNGTNTRRDLGSYPRITLASARKRALSNVQASEDGRNPWERKPTFAELADRTVAMNSKSWCGIRTEAIWRSTLNTYAILLFGGQHVGEIGKGDALCCLEPIWIERPHTARKPRMMLSCVFKPAIANGYRLDDPAQSVLALPPRRNVLSRHHPAVPHLRIGAVLATVRSSKADMAARLCLEWVVHTACHSDEARNVRWGTWTTGAELGSFQPGGARWHGSTGSRFRSIA